MPLSENPARSPTLHIIHASTFKSRLKGLLGKPGLAGNTGLLLTHCRFVHTIGMRFSLDLIFLDEHFCIVALHSSVRPFRIRGCRHARHVLEVSSGFLDKHPLQLGQKMELKP